ncbi:MAG: T9SS type A sorting domain-containing protein [Bacteroidales bacterium]|nr:T9SS type A sorting domain-containing protein [Bacteroidales bacterium]
MKFFLTTIFIILLSANLRSQNTNADSPFGMDPAQIVKTGYFQSHFADAQTLGVKWNRPSRFLFWSEVQPNLNTSTLIFGFYDTYFGEVPIGINIVANVAPAPNPVTNYTLPNSYLPIDTVKYIAFVKAAVERYDGDGVNDMPQLSNPILYWQVGNEPNCIVKQDFAKLQKMTYKAIKEVCPQCKILIGGTAQPIHSGQGFTTNKDDYITGFSNTYKPILQELNGGGFDIFDFHWYGNATGDYKLIQPVYEHLKLILDSFNFNNIPIWITEMGSYSGFPASEAGTPYSYQTELQQASDYLKRFVFSLSIGVKKVFPAFGLMEGLTNTDGYFDHTGFIYDGVGSNDLGLGEKKLSYYTYKKMVEILEGSNWSNIVTVQNDTVNNVFVYKFTKNGNPIYVAWWDYFSNKGYNPGDSIKITINGLSSTAKKSITQAIPNDTSGISITNYNTAFKIDTVSVQGNSVSFYLKERPLFVEELNTTSADETKGDNGVKVYPNPSNSTFNFQLPESNCQIKISDVMGNLIFEKTLSSKQETLNLNLTGGIYLYQIRNEQQVIGNGKLIIQ